MTTVGGGTVASPVLDDATAGDIDAIYNAVLDRDPSASDYVYAQVLLAGGGGLGSLMAAVAGSAESAADMASTYAAVGEAAPSQAEFGAFADAMSGSYGGPIELFSVDPVSGAQVVLADTSVTNLLAELPVLETEANGVNLGLQLADGAQIGFSSTARLADFLYAVAVQQLQATSFVTDNYNLDMQWLNTVDQPLLNEAVSWSEQAANETAAGGAYYTSLADENNAQASLALKIAAEAPGSRQDMSVTISNPYTGNPTQVTVYAGGGHSIHDYAPSIVNYVESAIVVLVNIAAVAFQQPEFYIAAAAIDAAGAGQDFSNGEDLQGILSVAQALSAGITAGAGGTVGGVAPPVSAQVINVASEAVGGVYGIVQSAENGNGAGILAGALEAAAAAAAGIGSYEGGNTQKTLNLVSTALGAASVATNVGEDFASGNLGQGLVDSLNLFLPEVAQEYAASQSNQSQLQQIPQNGTEADVGLSQGEIAFLNAANGQSANLLPGVRLSAGESVLIDEVRNVDDGGSAQINGSTLQAPVLMAFFNGGVSHNNPNILNFAAATGLYATPDEAAQAALEAINPTSIAENAEYGGKIYETPTGQFYAEAPTTQGSGTRFALSFNKEADALTVGDYHTHGDYSRYDNEGNLVRTSPYMDIFGSDTFSRGDIEGYDVSAILLNRPSYTGYLATPSGSILKYSAGTGEISILATPGHSP